MARKKLILEIDSDGRDFGKAFQITEMSADAAERWAIRLGFAMMNAGIDMPELDGISGMADIARIGLSALAKVPYESASPLLDEMMACIKIIPDNQKPNIVRDLIEGDIEEVSTRFKLKKEVWGLHVDFFTNAAQ